MLPILIHVIDTKMIHMNVLSFNVPRLWLRVGKVALVNSPIFTANDLMCMCCDEPTDHYPHISISLITLMFWFSE